MEISKNPQIVKFRCFDLKDRVWYPEDWVGSMSIWQLNARESRYAFMQFTGLVDFQGVEVYDGDIIATAKGVGRVRFNHGMFVISFRGTSVLKPACRNVLKPIAVLGNIHEHAELLDEEMPMVSL